MQVEALQIEGVHVTVRPEWTDWIHRELNHLEAHHPNALTRVRVRFRPIKQGRAGVSVLLDGQIDRVPFDIQRDDENALTALQKAFAVVMRNLEERADRGHHTPSPRTLGELPPENLGL